MSPRHLHPRLPGVPDCAECRAIVRALQTAWQDDKQALRARLRDVADTSGRSPAEFAVGWVFSLATMPDEEMRGLLDAHYPHVAEANRTRAAHEAATGHALKGWWMLLQYAPEEHE